ncbi:MAG: hypothetical protein MSB80_01040 [Alphaproteobacteria bacterium]|nr:hypothetical protein [Alphaproteobacteria bacterium]
MKILGIVCGCMAVIMLGIIVCFSYLDVMEMGLYPPAIMFVLYMTLFAFVFICNSKNTK